MEMTIAHFEALLEEMKVQTREAHSALKQVRLERREIDKLLSTSVKEMVDHRTDEVVKAELDKIGPMVREQTSLIYSKVGKEIDKLIDLALGKEFSTTHNREDLRPQLAKKLRVWIREIIEE